MSYDELHVGKLRKVDLNGKSIEEWCKLKCNELEILELEDYYKSWLECFKYVCNDDNEYFFTKDEIWEAFENVSSNESYTNQLIENKDGTLSYIMSFHNGGTCLTECIENALKDRNSNL